MPHTHLPTRRAANRARDAARHPFETLRALHAVLRPGGVLGVDEHRVPVGHRG